MGLFDDFRPEEAPSEAKEEPVIVKHGLRIALREGEPKAIVTAGVDVDYPLILMNEGNRDEVTTLKVDLVAGSDVSEPSDWIINVTGVEPKVWDLTFTGVYEKEVSLKRGTSKDITLSVTAPRGAQYGDRLNVIVTLTSQEDPAVSDAITLSTGTKQAVMAVKTSIGYEKAVADSIASRAKSSDVGVYSILSPTTMRGYVFVEVMNAEKLQQMVKGIRRARGLVRGDTSLDEIDHFLEPKPLVSGIMEGNIVELISGPFKGEKARVMHIDEAKEEITVELFEAMVPIPVTVRGDNVRVLEKETS
ncbi:MAG: transcription elongation factor Spt5 [Thermoplasmata archaeon]